MTAKIERIIEYQNIPRTPQEVIDFLNEQEIERIIVLYSDSKSLYWTAGSADRNYEQRDIHWDLCLFTRRIEEGFFDND